MSLLNEFAQEHKLISYVPGRCTPADDYKAIMHGTSWKERALLSAPVPDYGGDNFAHLPTKDAPDIDLDCDAAIYLQNKYFTPSWQYGRNSKGHIVQPISNPIEFKPAKYQIKMDGKVWIELRREGHYSVCKGKFEDGDKADLIKHDATPMTIADTWKAVNEIGLIAMLGKLYDGGLHEFRTHVAGEMLKQGIALEDTQNMFEKLLMWLHHSGECQPNAKGEVVNQFTPTSNDINNIYRKEVKSRLEHLGWTDKQVESVRKVIKAYYFKDELMEAVKEVKFEMPNFMTQAEIMGTEFPPRVDLVEGLLTFGLWFLSSKPKLGKSFLTSQLAAAIASGSEFLGKQCLKGDVFIFALEDNARRIKERTELTKQGNLENIRYAFVTPKIRQGFEDMIVQLKQQYPETKLIIIDTFIRAQDVGKQVGNDAYQQGSALVDKLQRVAIDNDVCVMCNTHDKKGPEKQNEDTINRMTGSQTFQGQDGNWRLDRTRGASAEATTAFTIVARDIPEATYEIEMTNGVWNMLGVCEAGFDEDKLTRDIKQAVESICNTREAQGEINIDATPKEIVAWLRATKKIEDNPMSAMYKRNENNVRARIATMTKQGKLIRHNRSGGRRVPDIKVPETEEMF